MLPIPIAARPTTIQTLYTYIEGPTTMAISRTHATWKIATANPAIANDSRNRNFIDLAEDSPAKPEVAMEPFAFSGSERPRERIAALNAAALTTTFVAAASRTVDLKPNSGSNTYVVIAAP